MGFATAGFVDYSRYFISGGAGWLVVGFVILIGAFASLIPQIILIVRTRTSYGLDPFFVCITNFGQLVVVVNVIALSPYLFIGLVQSNSFLSTIPASMTFVNTFALWYVYSSVVQLLWIFFDVKPRKNRSKETVMKEKLLPRFFFVVSPILSLLLVATLLIMTVVGGIDSQTVIGYGKTLGTIATLLVFVQYAPQMVTTFKLKDPGSLSIAMLAIQTPGGYVNALFMAIGQHNDWSTWLSYLISAIQMTVLLSMCIIFKCKKKKSPNADSSTTEIEDIQASSLNKSLINDRTPSDAHNETTNA